jgi:GNAT superfamily N-acetyltransferase
MADAQVDISGMPDPSTIGLTSTAQTGQTDISGMPTPEDLYTKHYGSAPASKDLLDEFMKNPPAEPTYQPTFKKSVSMLTGLPRAAASYAAAVPAGVASVAGQLTGVGGAIVDPEHAASYLEQGRDRGREWAANVSNLANYVPATERGAALSNDLTNLPANLTKETVGAGLKDVLPDNAYQAVSDVAQDVGNDLPALGAPAAVRGIAKGASKVASAAKGAVASEAATLTPPEPTAPLTPPVGAPITGDTLRATPNPIPAPDGTLHNEVHPAALPPQEAPATKQPAPVSQPAAAEAPTAAAEPSTATPSQVPEQEPTARAPAPEAAGTPSPGDAQRGSVRLFNSPAEEGPKETPQPEQQNERAAHLDAIDQLSGGQLPTRRTSALTGDYNATGDDWQMKEVGNPQMRQQVASENAAMHAATENVHDSVGSEFENSVDSQTLGDRGRVTRGAIQGIEGWFDKATDQTYDAARAANGGRPIASLNRVKAYLADDSNFTNDSEIGLQRAAQQRLQRLWSTGDPDKGTPPGSVNAAERFREFLNEKGKNPQAMGVAKDLKNATDMDVAEHGGPGLFETARAMRRHQYQMLEEPTGIKKLLTPGDSQGINHAIPEHKVMDYIADLPREQHEHVLNVLRAGAHLGGGELAEGSAAALREIQAHTISRMHAAATNADGSWNARKFYNAADRYARNAPDTFKDRPDILNNLKTINDAGNTLHMDKHYPGAAAQAERTGALGHALETGGNIAASFAHEIPMVGRFIGRHIESAAERAAGKVADTARDRAVAQRLVDRNGKQRGSVQVLPDKEESGVGYAAEGRSHVATTANGETRTRLDGGGNLRVISTHTEPAARGAGEGTARLERLAQEAHKMGGKLVSDSEVSAPEQNVYKTLARKGYDVKMNPHTTDPGTGVQKSASELRGVYEVGPRPPVKGGPSGQRGSVQLFNDNKLNRSADNANDQRRGVGINPRNERNERTANQQMGGRKPLSDEQNDILNRLSGGKQRGSVKVMSDQEAQDAIDHFSAPENARKLRGTISTFKKQYPSMLAYHIAQAAKEADVEPKEMWQRIVKRLASK